MLSALEGIGSDFDTLAPDLGWYRLSPQVERFPSTRFMGSKEQLLLPLWRAIGQFAPQSVLDLCSGSGVVSYMLKTQGCRVFSNDYMRMATTIAEATISNSKVTLSETDIAAVLEAVPSPDRFVEHTYGELYFGRSDVRFIDSARAVIAEWSGPKRSIAMAALIRACIKRRPRGIFTYTGARYDDGRRDLRLSLQEHFVAAAVQLNDAVFDNGRVCEVHNVDLSNGFPDVRPDVVYLDPPYFSPLSDNEYVRRYHFTEALARDWQGVEIQHQTKTKKIKNYPSPFRSEIGCLRAIGEIVDYYRESVVVISYSSNSLPSACDMLAHLRRHGRTVGLTEVNHRYSFANQAKARRPIRNAVKELIFVAQ
jgi:DNA adenine methylase